MEIEAKNKQITPYYLKIREDIINQLEKNPNYKIPSEKQLCEIYEVSRPTVRKALEYLVEKRLIIRKKGKGTYPILNEIKRRGSIQDTVLIVLHEDWDIRSSEEYLSNIMEGIFLGNRNKRFDFKILNFSSLDFYNKFKKSECFYSIWISPEKEEKTMMEKLTNEGHFIVALNRIIENSSISYVSCNHRKGGMIATEYLLNYGHRKICYVPLIENLSFLKERYRGFYEAHIKSGFMPYLKIICKEENFNEIKEKVKKVLLEKEKPSAFFIGAGLYQQPVIEAINEVGLKIPQDVSIVSFDKVQEITEKHSLSYIEQPEKKIGEVAIRKIIESFEKKDFARFRIILEPKLVKGKSVKKIIKS